MHRYDRQKPEILIGHADNAMGHLIQQTVFGIEEEGCLFHTYSMKEAADIRYSGSNVTIIIQLQTGGIYLNDVRKNQILYEIESTVPELYRQMGMNAARFLKGKPLKL